MFIEIPVKTYRNLWCCYVITDSLGNGIDVNIVKFTDLTNVEISTDEEKVFMMVIGQDEDRSRLANSMLSELPKRGMPKLQWKLLELIKYWSANYRCHGHRVICVETGESWNSIRTCAAENNVNYGQLLNHLKERSGFKSVKGRTYRYA